MIAFATKLNIRVSKLILTIITVLGCYYGKAQHKQHIVATLHDSTKTLSIQQKITYYNNTSDTLNQLYLHDWQHSYSSKKTALAKRFAEEFNKSLHLAKKHERGGTNIITVSDDTYRFLHWERLNKYDAIKIQLKHPIYPNQSQTISLSYTIKLPDAKFTGYGYYDNGDYNLLYWHLIPAVYNGEWLLYNNKNLNDLYQPLTDYSIEFNYPKKLTLVTDFNSKEETALSTTKKATLEGDKRLSSNIILKADSDFYTYKTENLTLVTNLNQTKISEIQKGISIERIGNFITKYLGEYPHQKLLVSTNLYNRNPLYGINQLPSFLRPYSEEFHYELMVLKTTLNQFLQNTIHVNPREESWLTDALQTYLMILYVDTFYPDVKLLGKFSKIWGVRSFHLAQMSFNDQYALLHMLMARQNIDQALSTPKDSLLKFNQKIANKYKAGLGLLYLDHYTSKQTVLNAIKEFYQNNKLATTSPESFKNSLQKYSNKKIDWFFTEYVGTNKRIDFKIDKIVKTKDSAIVTIKNKTGTHAPISLYAIANDSVIFKTWIDSVVDYKTVTIPKKNAERLVLNYDRVIPEFNQRDNWKTLGGFFSSNKKLKFQFFKDAENPYYNQVFYVPILTYNFYDGVTPGMRLYNKTLLERPFIFDLRPSYATKEKTLVGSGILNYRKYFQNQSLYRIDTGILGSSFHYAPDLRYSTLTPHISFRFRNEDLRSNERKMLMLRYVNVFRDLDPNIETDPDYRVFNVRFNHYNNDIINFYSWFTDLQVADKFTKIAFNAEFRRLYENNTQLNLRFFIGKFIKNNTGTDDGDFFSFALDRPTDYLFDYDYLGRSEASGIFSQQLIIAEGGFKSKLEPAFSNDWIATANASINIWKWVEFYGDVGFVKNKNVPGKFVYDSGIRLNLVTDYFELYFPLYSNNGWEIAQPNYDQRIRFVVTLQPRALLGLFTRKWF